MEFGLTIHDSVYRALDGLFDHATVSQIAHDLHRELPALPPAMRGDRDPNEPDVFYHVRLMRAFGLWRTVSFAVNDGWEPDRLHVVGVTCATGGRGF